MAIESKIEEHEHTALAPALHALRAGEVIVYPTETFYGLGVDFSVRGALERLFLVKAREPGKPIALIAATAEMAFSVARAVPPAARRLAEKFWPGPLTLVLPAVPGLPDALVGPDGGVGVRVSSHRIARALAAAMGRPLTATSANLAGAPPARTISEARAALENRVAVYLDGGTMSAAAPSTVVTFEGSRTRLLRAGAIAEAALHNNLK
ncbi:MAG TPA: L-threonylcarbamoyladenylate synthase [Candidatus Binataceae bacterium]|nr:L-threonylcarbamoyladenylate synthase [Candidatus Binataceae bacterium]